MPGPRRERWDRQEGETAKEFARFRSYLDLPREGRSFRGAYRAHTGREAAPPGSWYIVAERRAWEDRALAHDRAEDRKIEAALRARRLRVLVKMADLGDGLMEKADLGKKLLAPIERTLSGSVIPAWHPSASDVARLAETGAKLASLGVGMPTDRTSVQDGGADEAAELLASAKDELNRRIEAIRARHQQARAYMGDAVRGLMARADPAALQAIRALQATGIEPPPEVLAQVLRARMNGGAPDTT